jgi:hypothetical protein
MEIFQQVAQLSGKGAQLFRKWRNNLERGAIIQKMAQ